MITIDLDVTQVTILAISASFAVGVKIARDEYLNKKNKEDHQSLAKCIHLIMEHFGLKEGLEDLKSSTKDRR